MNSTFTNCGALLCFTLFKSLPFSSTEAAALPNAKKIVVIAGKKSHGPEGNRTHDYPWSAKLIKVMFDNSNVRERVQVEFFRDGWPADQRSLEDANSIVIISDGRDGELYSEALQFESPERVAFVDRQIKRGCG